MLYITDAFIMKSMHVVCGIIFFLFAGALVIWVITFVPIMLAIDATIGIKVPLMELHKGIELQCTHTEHAHVCVMLGKRQTHNLTPIWLLWFDLSIEQLESSTTIDFLVGHYYFF